MGTRSWTFFVRGPLPGLNEMLDAAKASPRAYAEMKRKWTEAVWAASRAAKVPRLERVRLRLGWCESSERRDPDNIHAAQKFVWDGLVGPKPANKAGNTVLANDGWKQNAGVEHRHRVGGPAGVWIAIAEEEPLGR